MDPSRSVVQILADRGPVAGAGFLVAEDLVVTSVHALVDPDPQSRPEITFELTAGAGPVVVPHGAGPVQVAVPQLTGRVIAADVVDDHDLELADGCVLLRLRRIPKGLEPLKLSSGELPAEGALVVVAGFPGSSGAGSRSRDAADIRTVRARLGPAGAGRLRRLSGLDDVTGVWLGAPVFHEATGTVTGVVTRFTPHGSMGEPATAAMQPISVLGQQLPAAPHPWLRHHRVLLGGLAAALAAALIVVPGVLRPGAPVHARAVSRQLAALSSGLDAGDPMKPLLAAAALGYAPTRAALAAARPLLVRASFALRGHTGTVDDVAFSPDGSTLASAGTDGSVRLWDLRTHRQLGASIVEPGSLVDIVTAVAFSPDGHVLATSQFAGTVTLRDVVTREQIGSLITPLVGPGRKDQTLSLAFDPIGNVLATGGTQGAVRLWDAGNQQQIDEPMQDASFDSVGSVAFSPDGATLATGLSDGTVRLWNVSTRRGPVIGGHTEAVRGVAFSPDGRLLATAGTEGLTKLWDVRSQRLTATLPVRSGEAEPGDLAGGAANGVAFSPDGSTVATAQGDGTVRLWSLDGRQRGPALDAGEGQVVSVAFSPDGQRLAASGDRGAVRVWDLRAPDDAAPDTPERAQQDEMVRALCETAGRPMTRQEWRSVLPDEPFRQSCPELPAQPAG